MGKSNRKGSQGGYRRAKAVRPHRFGRGLTMLLTIVALAAAGFFLLHRIQTGMHWPAARAAKTAAAHSEVKAGLDRLQSRWVRPDGGYVLEIKAIDADGKMAAAYFNPRPINVSRAEASGDGTSTKVFIELRDMNYPGATYTLTYDPVRDQLRGVYVQPALQQSFDVVFVRMK